MTCFAISFWALREPFIASYADMPCYCFNIISSIMSLPVLYMYMQLTSQHPYMEQHVGKPRVYTIDISDSRVLRQTVTDIKNSPV